ncbi:CHASE2 domain-containing protein [Spirulina major CS-329]|uniref:CHASE2 domain-containing protein n=1 Tax=Spirulina TaxID=1154 RepID=UPI00232B90CF|nr:MULTISPECIES: CHASE2 domain-containing protein [Spirulina]MDB9496830.1 CHASE2 domain-containing protein [Spirulina subsalsa CS-330]MDB9504993.1 CHASE2 domain-containing protein [Spirulina major CS-329]
MAKLAVLKLVGDFERGFDANLAIAAEGQYPTTEITGSLPPALPLQASYQQWRSLYHRAVLFDRAITPKRITYDGSPAARQRDCQAAAQDLDGQLNDWLTANSFRAIERKCLELLSPSDEVRVVIQSACRDLLRLPWQRWHFIDCYQNVEVALRSCSARLTPTLQTATVTPNPQPRRGDGVRILSILGDSQDIEVEQDRRLLETLPGTELMTLVEPQHRDINDHLWEQPWDILFFAGHGRTQGDEGHLYINPNEHLTLKELKYGLQKAIAQGLQIAIFNACDGLGLAWDLDSLPIPHLIVMREPVPDRVAQAFLDYFLQSYAAGQSFPMAVREARERLQGLETDYVCASWLPVTFRHPAIAPPSWHQLGGKQQPALHSGLITLVFTNLVNSTVLKNQLTGADRPSRDRQYFEDILLPHRHRVEAQLSHCGGRVVETEGDSYFIVFTSAEVALQWALQLQQSHQNDPIPTPLGNLQVRIGMHTGSPLQDGPKFVGQEVDYAARVSALANGEQVLLSDVTAALVRSRAGQSFRLHNHGDRALTGIGTVPIYQALLPQQQPQALRGDDLNSPQRGGTIASLVATALVVGLRLLGALQGMELQAFDTLMRSRPAEAPDPRLLVITATETDLQQYGAPLPDGVIAEAIAALQPHNPRLIGLNLFRDRPRQPGTDQLRAQLQAENAIVLCSVSEASNPNKPGIAPPPNVPTTEQGFSDLIVDPDRVLRRHLLFIQPETEDACQTEYAFSTRLALRYLHLDNVDIKNITPNQHQVGPAILNRLSNHAGAYHHLDNRGFQLMLNYRAGEAAPMVKLTDLLAGKVDPDLIEDRIILFGIVAPLSNSAPYFLTPYSAKTHPYQEMPGIMLQAHMTSQLLAAALDGRSLIWVLPEFVEILWIALWAAIGGFGVGRLSHKQAAPWVWGVDVAASGLLLSGLCWLALLQGGWLPWAPAGMALAIGAGSKLTSSPL